MAAWILTPALGGLQGEQLPRLTQSLVGAEAARAAGAPRLSAALRSCLAGIGCRLVDASNPAALRAASSDRLWAKLHSSQVPLAVIFPRSAQQVAASVLCARQAGVKVTARWEGGPSWGRSRASLAGRWRCRLRCCLAGKPARLHSSLPAPSPPPLSKLVAYPGSPDAAQAAPGLCACRRSGGGSFLGYSVRAGTVTVDLTEMGGVVVAPNRVTVAVEVRHTGQHRGV